MTSGRGITGMILHQFSRASLAQVILHSNFSNNVLQSPRSLKKIIIHLYRISKTSPVFLNIVLWVCLKVSIPTIILYSSNVHHIGIHQRLQVHSLIPWMMLNSLGFNSYSPDTYKIHINIHLERSLLNKLWQLLHFPGVWVPSTSPNFLPVYDFKDHSSY